MATRDLALVGSMSVRNRYRDADENFQEFA